MARTGSGAEFLEQVKEWVQKAKTPEQLRAAQAAAACVTTGELDSLILPQVNSECMQIFLDAVAARHPKRADRDGAGWGGMASKPGPHSTGEYPPVAVATLRSGTQSGRTPMELEVPVTSMC